MRYLKNCNKFDKEYIYAAIHILVFGVIATSSVILLVKVISNIVLKVIASVIVVIIQAYIYERIGFITEGFLDIILKDKDDNIFNDPQINEILNKFTNDCKKDITIKNYNRDIYKLLINNNIPQEKVIMVMRELKKKESQAGLYKNSKIKK